MARYYRYRLPPWARQCLFVIEAAMAPLVVYQLLRTLLFPTTLDVFLLGIFIIIYIAFYLEWF